MDYRKSATEILEYVGGQGNVASVMHCFTRLRFSLRDESKVQKERLERVEGVIQVVRSGGLTQVVLGSKVEKVFNELSPMLGLDNRAAGTGASISAAGEGAGSGAAEPKGNAFNNVLQMISAMFTPLIPAIAASGLIKGLLTAARLIFKNYGMDISNADTYVILFAASQVIFYFMPIFLAYTAAKALKCNPVIAMSVGATLVYPQIDTLIQNVKVATTIFGLPVTKGVWSTGASSRVFSYVESVIPIILSVVVLAYLERFLKKYIPEVLQIIMVPGLSLMLMIPVTLVVLGPVGIFVGNVIQVAYNSVIGFNAVLGGALIGGLWGVFVIFGAHRALLPIGLNDVAVSGRQNLLAFAGAANFSQGGAALGVALKTKNKQLRGVSISAVISAALVGITEPAIYGCNLRLKKPMVIAVICGALGGGLMGFGNVYGDAFANNGVLTIFTYAAFGMTQFMFYLAGCAIAFFGAAALTYVVGFEDEPVLEDGVVAVQPALARVPATAAAHAAATAAAGTQSVRTHRPALVLATAAAGAGAAGSATLTAAPTLFQTAATAAAAEMPASAAPVKPLTEAEADFKFTSPVKGVSIPLSDVADEVFASGALGHGLAVLPAVGEIVAPCDCTVAVLYPTGHAMGFLLDGEVEMLVHVGMNTVELDGKYFTKHVEQGQAVKKGTRIVSFDKDAIEAAGYDISIPVIVSNSARYANVTAISGTAVDENTNILLVKQ